MRQRRVFVLFLVTCVSACASPASRETVAPIGLVTPTPVVSPTPPAPQPSCFVSISSDGQSLATSVDALASISPVIFAAEFTGYGPAVWDTADGKRPAKVSDGMLLRPLEVEVSSILRGEAMQIERVMMRGGQSGCDSITVNCNPKIVEGSSYVFFVAAFDDYEGNKGSLLGVYTAWPISPNGLVNAPLEGQMSLTELEAKVARSPYRPG